MEAIRKSDEKPKPRIMTPAIKPGTRSAYLWELPDEEIDRMLREHGIDIEELDRILEEGGGIITFNHAKTNQRRRVECEAYRNHRRKGMRLLDGYADKLCIFKNTNS